MNIFKKLALPFKGNNFLTLLLTADLFYMLLHIISITMGRNDIDTMIRDEVFRINIDHGLGESFQYAKEYWIFILFIWLIIKHKKYSFIGWAVLFLLILFDDMFLLHELFAGSLLTQAGLEPFQEISEFRILDFGELGFLLIVGTFFLIYLVCAYYYTKPETRAVFINLAKILLFIAFFGVFFDFISHIIERNVFSLVGAFLSLFEDGGEMIGMSIMCWYVYTLTETIHTNPTIDSVK